MILYLNDIRADVDYHLAGNIIFSDIYGDGEVFTASDARQLYQMFQNKTHFYTDIGDFTIDSMDQHSGTFTFSGRDIHSIL